MMQPDPVKIARAIGLDPVGEPIKVPSGADFTTYSLECADHGRVALRITQIWRTGQIKAETAAMSMARLGGVAVPPVVRVGTSGPFAAMAVGWVPGVTMWQALEQQPALAEDLGREFGRTQACIHAVSASDLPLARWMRPAAKGAKTLQWALATAKGTRPCLVHLDYHPLNVLTEAGRITGVIDWTNAGRGEPRMDIARTYTILRFETPARLRAMMRTFLRGWLAGYSQSAGQLGQLAPFLAWAGEAMVHDLAARKDAAFLDRIGTASAGWRRHAGRPGGMRPVRPRG